jgi:hypothetical protein
VTTYLQGHGWATASLSTNELLTKCGLTPLESDEGFGDVVYITARK